MATTVALHHAHMDPIVEDAVLSTAAQPASRNTGVEVEAEAAAAVRELHGEMRELLKKWIRLTESESVQKEINLSVEKADDLFRNVAHVKGKKRLFVCCDGTLQNAVGTIRPMSNVAKLARSVYRLGNDDFDCGTLSGVPQLAYYSSGIGSNSIVGIDGLVAATTGKGFTSTVLNAYCFISNNYNGSSLRDDIILVGYSRGAFAMRCLAQFISDVGLLRRAGLPHLALFWKLWLSDEKAPGEDQPKWRKMKDELGFLFFAEVKIKVLAEWDPVKSLVWPSLQGTKRLANMTKTVPKRVENAFVAIALHENRWSYKPVLWEQYEEGQEVCQCAFLGSHSDIGGGNVDAGLSTISLFWMVSKIENACKAQFNDDELLQFVIPERVRAAPRIRRPIGKREICLTTQALSQGNVNQPCFLWQLPRFIPFRLWLNGDRRRLLESVATQATQQEETGLEGAGLVETGPAEAGTENVHVKCELEIHQTVNWIVKHWGSGKSPSALNGFTFVEADGWKSHKDAYLKESEMKQKERVLMTAWLEVARKAQLSLEFLRRQKQEAKRQNQNPTTNMADDRAESPEQDPQEDQETGHDENVFHEVRDWRRWRGAVKSEGTMGLETSLIRNLGPFFEDLEEGTSGSSAEGDSPSD